MPVIIEEVTAFQSSSGVIQIEQSGWTNDPELFFKIKEPSGCLLRGYSISLVSPGDDETFVPDEDEVTNNPGGAWIFGGATFTWDFDIEHGWGQGRWYDGIYRRNFWDMETDGMPPSGIPPS